MKKLKPYIFTFLFIHYIFSMYGKSFHPFNWSNETCAVYGTVLFASFFALFLFNYLYEKL